MHIPLSSYKRLQKDLAHETAAACAHNEVSRLAVVPTILTTLAVCPSRIHLDVAEKVWGLNLGFYKEILPSGGHLPILFKISMKKKIF